MAGATGELRRSAMSLGVSSRRIMARVMRCVSGASLVTLAHFTATAVMRRTTALGRVTMMLGATLIWPCIGAPTALTAGWRSHRSAHCWRRLTSLGSTITFTPRLLGPTTFLTATTCVRSTFPFRSTPLVMHLLERLTSRMTLAFIQLAIAIAIKAADELGFAITLNRTSILSRASARFVGLQRTRASKHGHSPEHGDRRNSG